MASVKIADMGGIREYCEGEPVEVWDVDGRLVLRAYNEARFRGTEVDLLDLLEWLSGRGVIRDLDIDTLRSKLSDRADHPGHAKGD